MSLVFVKRLAAVLVVVGAAFTQAAPAEAADQFPSGTSNITASVKWSGEWESVHRLDDITVQLCDLDLVDPDEATARIEAWLETANGAVTRQLAPVVMRVRQGGANSCREYSNMYLGYSDYLRFVRVVYGGSESGLSSGTRWVENPNSGF